MRLKNFTLSILFLLSFGFANAQCDVANGSFEDWVTTDFVLPDGAGGEASAEVLLPAGTTPFIRLLLLSLSAAFDPSFAALLQNEAQELLGISQSTDASKGNFAVKLQSGYDVETADIYSFFGCSEVPKEISLDIKHIGNSEDSITVIVIFDEGLGEVPQSEAELAEIPYYATAVVGFDSDSEYETVTLSTIQNFEAPVDTVYYIIAVETSENSYFLIDNMVFKGDGTDCEVAAPVLTFTTEDPICICNNLDATFPLAYTTEPEFQYRELIVDEFGTIVSLDFEDDPGFHSEFCDSSDSLTAVIIAFLDVDGLNEGNNINDISGCFELSNTLPLNTYRIPEFELNISIDGVLQDENINICLLDEIIESFSFSINMDFEKIAILLIDNDTDDVVVRIDDVNEVTTFMGIPPGEYFILAVNFDGNFNIEAGQGPDEITFDGCFAISDNQYEVNILGPDDNCLTDVEEIYSGNLSIRPNYSKGLFEIYNPSNESFQVEIRDISGRNVRSGDNDEIGGFIDLQELPNGVYIASFKIDGQIHQEKIVKM